MTLYELLKQISDILTPQTHSLYDYMIHTFDDNGGFLRTRWCYWDDPVPDFPVADLNEVLICFRHPFREGDPYYKTERYGETFQYERKNTLVKMQLFYAAGNMDDDIAWSCQFPYTEAYIINLMNRTFEVRHYEPLC